MAKKRITKKKLNYIMSDLLTATIVASATQEPDIEKILGIQDRIIKTHDDFNSRLSNYERKKAKPFFKQYKEEFNKAVSDIIDDITALSK